MIYNYIILDKIILYYILKFYIQNIHKEIKRMDEKKQNTTPKQRVQLELEQLDKRRIGLIGFKENKEAFQKLPKVQQKLLKRQLIVMTYYRKILVKRLDKWVD